MFTSTVSCKKKKLAGADADADADVSNTNSKRMSKNTRMSKNMSMGDKNENVVDDDENDPLNFTHHLNENDSGIQFILLISLILIFSGIFVYYIYKRRRQTYKESVNVNYITQGVLQNSSIKKRKNSFLELPILTDFHANESTDDLINSDLSHKKEIQLVSEYDPYVSVLKCSNFEEYFAVFLAATLTILLLFLLDNI